MNHNQDSQTNEYYFDSDNLLHSDIYDDIYFSTSGAEAESEHVFINGNNLPERFATNDRFTIAEAGFGTGLNFLKTLEEWEKHFTPDKQLTYIGFESTPLATNTLIKSHQNWPSLTTYSDLLLSNYPPVVMGQTVITIAEYNITLKLLIGDINNKIQDLDTIIDAWFLDGFSPAKNPEMWSNELFAGMSQSSARGSTTVATYSCARVVKEGLANNGFTIDKVPGFGKKRFMLNGRYL